MLALKKIIILLGLICLLSGCIIFPLKKTDQNQSLSGCPPLPNCVSTQAVTVVHHIQPFQLAVPVAQAWPIIRDIVSNLQGTSIEAEYPGYIYAKSYSRVLHFLDYFEVLWVAEQNSLNVRSSSLLGIYDFRVNFTRIETFRESLLEKGVIKESEQ